MTYSLIVSIVPRGEGEVITQTAVKAGSFGGTIMMGRGLSSKKLAVILGLETTKDIVYILTDDEHRQGIFDAIYTSSKEQKQHYGYVFCMNAGYMIKCADITGEEPKMTQDNTHELITIIVNRGYADDAMEAARKAGATGGTAINARGTAREDDAKFFGVHIVPEKELLLIVVEKEKKDAVLEAVRTLGCLSQPGSGIAYSSPVSDFTPLGKQN